MEREVCTLFLTSPVEIKTFFHFKSKLFPLVFKMKIVKDGSHCGAEDCTRWLILRNNLDEECDPPIHGQSPVETSSKRPYLTQCCTLPTFISSGQTSQPLKTLILIGRYSIPTRTNFTLLAYLFY